MRLDVVAFGVWTLLTGLTCLCAPVLGAAPPADRGPLVLVAATPSEPATLFDADTPALTTELDSILPGTFLQTSAECLHEDPLPGTDEELLLVTQCETTPGPTLYADGCEWRWTDSLELFLGIEGSKQPQDFGVNAQFGGRAHINWAMPLWQEAGLGLQVGTALVQTDHAVAVTSAVEGSSSRTQSFTTLGVFQRLESGWVWGLGHDFLYQEDYDSSVLTQWRGRAGYEFTPRNEAGVMFTIPQKSQEVQWSVVPLELRSLTQGTVYWRHTWAFGGQTTGWVGGAESHGQANAALGDRPKTGTVLVWGADVHVPLNDSWALFGEANFVTPADTGTVDAYLGLAYYPGRGARVWRNRAWSPVLPVVSNSAMPVDLHRR